MPPTITADLALDHALYAKAPVNKYKADLKTIKSTITTGGYIGKIYSWYIDNTGRLWWVFYDTPYDYANFNGSYVLHDGSKLSLPDLPGILQKIAEEREAKKKQDMGLISYYVEKYAPWLIGAGVVAIALPTVIGSAKAAVKRPAMSGMKKNDVGVAAVLLFGTGILMAATSKKKKKPADIIISYPKDRGAFLTDEEYEAYLREYFPERFDEYELVPH